MRPAFVLCLSDDDLCDLAICKVSEVKPTNDGKAPDWIQLIPAGDKVKALDGREFSNSTPESVVESFNKDPRDVPVDWEHATETKAPFGEEAPAAGWLKELEVRDGAVWGRVEWTPRAKEQIENKEYRYISPAFEFMAKTKKVLRIISAALTNRPALAMPALARAKKDGPPDVDPTQTNKGTARTEEKSMNPELLKLLGLAEGATEDQVSDAIKAMNSKLSTASSELATASAKVQELTTEVTTLRQKDPSVDKFVPRAEYDSMVQRATAAEQKIKDGEKAQHDKAVEDTITAALKDGKITPASKDYFTKSCSTAEGLAAFNEFVKTAPKLGEPSDLDDKDPPDSGSQVDKAELAIAQNCGISAEDYRESKKDVVL